MPMSLDCSITGMDATEETARACDKKESDGITKPRNGGEKLLLALQLSVATTTASPTSIIGATQKTADQSESDGVNDDEQLSMTTITASPKPPKATAVDV